MATSPSAATSGIFTPTSRNCKLCRKNPRCIDNSGNISLYCGNACAKKAGGPLPNPENLVKRSKGLSLAKLLEQEATIEKGKVDPAEPESVARIRRSGIWNVESIDGQRDVVFTRTFGPESIRVGFSMAELDPFEPDDDSDEEDNDDNAKTQIKTQEDDSSSDDTLEDAVECTISITKPGQGALLFDCYASSTELEILKVSYIKDSRLVSEDTADSERKLRDFCVGPEYEGLPKRIQEEFSNYLGDREIDNSLAQAISDFVTYKTQKEAQGWFEAVGSFVANE